MGLETGTYISDLNASNPIHATDQVSQGDDHIRLIKSVILNTFPNVNGAVNFTPTEANYLDGLTGVTGSGSLVASASPTLTGTLTAAAITATTYDGIAAANLVDKSATETVSGNWTFSGSVALNGAITGLSSDDLSDVASIAMLDEAETVSGQWNFTTGPQVADVEVGHASDTTLGRKAAGTLSVEGDAVFSHDSGTYTSAKIFFSNGTEPTTEGANGDIFLVY